MRISFLVGVLFLSHSGFAAPPVRLLQWAELVPCYTSPTQTCLTADGSLLGLALTDTSFSVLVDGNRVTLSPAVEPLYWIAPLKDTLGPVLELPDAKARLQPVHTSAWVLNDGKWVAGSVSPEVPTVLEFPEMMVDRADFVSQLAHSPLHFQTSVAIQGPEVTLVLKNAAALGTVLEKWIAAAGARKGHGCGFASQWLEDGLVKIESQTELADEAQEALLCAWAKTQVLATRPNSGKYYVSEAGRAVLKKESLVFKEGVWKADWYLSLAQPACARHADLPCEGQGSDPRWILGKDAALVNANLALQAKLGNVSPTVATHSTVLKDAETGFEFHDVKVLPNGKKQGLFLPKAVFTLKKGEGIVEIQRKYLFPGNDLLPAIEARLGLTDTGVLNNCQETRFYVKSASGEKTLVVKSGPETSFPRTDKPYLNIDWGKLKAKLPESKSIVIEQTWRDSQETFVTTSEIKLNQ